MRRRYLFRVAVAPIVAGVLTAVAPAAGAGQIDRSASPPALAPIVAPSQLPMVTSNGLHVPRPTVNTDQTVVAATAMPAARDKAPAPAPSERRAANHGGKASSKRASLASEPTAACIKRASRVEGVPVLVIRTIMRTEGGRMGSEVGNTNGSHDLGWMQINDATWLDTLAKAEFNGNRRITRYLLRYNGCYNVATGAWILRQYYDETVDEMGPAKNVTGRAKRWARAIGYYNSHNRILMHHYRQRAGRKLRQILATTQQAAGG